MDPRLQGTPNPSISASRVLELQDCTNTLRLILYTFKNLDE